MKNFMNQALMNYAINMFNNLAFDNKISNDFFETFCPGQKILHTVIGNQHIYYSDQAFERFHDYEEFLEDLYMSNRRKYKKIHKGTPFFFMAWLSFFMNNFDNALYYLDAAVSEDSKNAKGDWINLPAGKFLLLQEEGHNAVSTAIEIKEVLSHQFARLNRLTGSSFIDFDNFMNNFIKKIIRIKKNRTLISSLYIFFLEYHTHLKELELRSSFGGTIYPFIKHLFNGGLIFESLLKIRYPKSDKGEESISIGNIFKNSRFIQKYGGISGISSDSIKNILSEITDNSLKTSFRITATIRNTLGHNLIRDDAFKNKENYKKLYEQEVNAILYFIKNEFL